MVEKLGRKYGKLLVVSENKLLKRGGVFDYWCLCDCGNIARVEYKNLRDKLHTRSCGCYKKEATKKARYLGYGVASFNGLFNKYKSFAKELNRVFELSEDEFKKLTKSNCYYCGKEPSQIRKYNTTPYIYNGIDRLDNSIGYVKENCVPCCGVCNYMKHTKSYEEFIENIERIYNYHVRKNKKKKAS